MLHLALRAARASKRRARCATPPTAVALAAALALGSACDPTATRLTAKQLEFSFAAAAIGFDHQGNLLLTGLATPQVVRMNHATQQFEDLSNGLPSGEHPSGELLADSAGNLAGGGWYRAATADGWAALTSPPANARPGPQLGKPQTPLAYTLDGTGTVYAVMLDTSDTAFVAELHRMTPPTGAWERLATGLPMNELDSFRARLDGTVFIGRRVWRPGASALTPLVTCPSSRIDQACQDGFLVFTHPRRNETYLAAPPNPGVTKGRLFQLPAGATFPVDYDTLVDLPLKGGPWQPVRVSSDGVLHVAAVQQVPLDYPPYSADEATLFAVTDRATPEARLLWTVQSVVGDRRDVYKASAQLVGRTWQADPVYVWKF